MIIDKNAPKLKYNEIESIFYRTKDYMRHGFDN